jgi:hypothetical protein
MPLSSIEPLAVTFPRYSSVTASNVGRLVS